MSSFQLNKQFCNQALYAEIRDFWFQDIPEKATTAPPAVIKKWFGHFETEEEKDQFDQICHSKFCAALESFGPSEYKLPPASSWEAEQAHAEEIADPFLADCTATFSSDEEYEPNFLSIILLLDQLSRNIFRQDQAQIYNHYDRIARALLYSILKLTPRPDLHPSFRFSPVHRFWLYMPLMHSEHIEDQEKCQELMQSFREEMLGRDDQPGLDYVEMAIKGAKTHARDIREFGRFPHRNEHLGRATTREEQAFMDGGGNAMAPKKATN
ncbi:hypothetical protein BKA61DRAFT_585356 [Leptodontidium sp. MPI-SDFR-AT-0119]|nr:hypothetical protein BKA61DRAFT_585356 [Leptodontidium sp. MPI-SDFR-AT-0119]